MKKRPEAHGNQAKIDPNKKILGEYTTNAVTMAENRWSEKAFVKETNIELAREFSEENKK